MTPNNDSAPIGVGLSRKVGFSSSLIWRAKIVAFLDELKERHGLRNRGQVLEQLIEIGETVTQQ